MANTEFTIFYAWQSDSPAEQNRIAILRALTEAAAAVESEQGLVVIIDQATRDLLGADNVADTIRAKIESADMFVGDITTIASTDRGIRRSSLSQSKCYIRDRLRGGTFGLEEVHPADQHGARQAQGPSL